MSYYSSHLGTIVIYWARMCYRNINMKNGAELESGKLERKKMQWG